MARIYQICKEVSGMGEHSKEVIFSSTRKREIETYFNRLFRKMQQIGAIRKNLGWYRIEDTYLIQDFYIRVTL